MMLSSPQSLISYAMFGLEGVRDWKVEGVEECKCEDLRKKI